MLMQILILGLIWPEPARQLAIGTERRVERSDLPSVECSPRTNVLRTRMRCAAQTTSRQRNPSSSDWRRCRKAPVKPSKPTPVTRDVYWEGEAQTQMAPR